MSSPRRIPAESAERTKSLNEALEQFESLYKSYREQMAGLTAQMWQAKCYEEQGDDRRGHRHLQAASGVTSDAQLRPPAECRLFSTSSRWPSGSSTPGRPTRPTHWLEKYNRREERRSQEGLGVLLELAKNIDAQIGQVTSKTERQRPPRPSSMPSRRWSATRPPTRTTLSPCSRNTSRPRRPAAEELGAPELRRRHVPGRRGHRLA